MDSVFKIVMMKMYADKFLDLEDHIDSIEVFAAMGNHNIEVAESGVIYFTSSERTMCGMYPVNGRMRVAHVNDKMWVDYADPREALKHINKLL